LHAVPRSVLWLSQGNAIAAANLRREAERRGIDAARIVFADRIPSSEEHMARLRAADLFLDTHPYNAHATAVDALRAGLPVLTFIGQSFAARVGASLLFTLGMRELVASTPAAYEEMAVQLATDPQRLMTIKLKLNELRHNAPLFDGRTFTRALETAYTVVYQRHQAGLPPDHFSVSEDPPPAAN
jgi:protein O-GlcNAc transferase